MPPVSPIKTAGLVDTVNEDEKEDAVSPVMIRKKRRKLRPFLNNIDIKQCSNNLDSFSSSVDNY